MIAFAVTLAYPTTFRNSKQSDNVTDDSDYGLYAPVAMLLTPLPTNGESGMRNRINQLPVNFRWTWPTFARQSQLTTDPWYQDNSYYSFPQFYGNSKV